MNLDFSTVNTNHEIKPYYKAKSNEFVFIKTRHRMKLVLALERIVVVHHRGSQSLLLWLVSYDIWFLSWYPFEWLKKLIMSFNFSGKPLQTCSFNGFNWFDAEIITDIPEVIEPIWYGSYYIGPITWGISYGALKPAWNVFQESLIVVFRQIHIFDIVL